MSPGRGMVESLWVVEELGLNRFVCEQPAYQYESPTGCAGYLAPAPADCFTLAVSDRLADLEAILFDFGGTLDADGVAWIDRFAAAYAKAGLDVPLATLREASGHGTRQAYHSPQVAGFDLRATVAFHVACQFAHLKIENPAAAARVVDLFVSWAESALADSRAVLERLSRRFKLGVVSNFYGNVDRILEQAGVAPLLGAIVDSTVAGVSKPDPRIFALALERLQARPAAALFVGDSLEQDIAPARAAGLRTAWLRGERAAGEGTAADVCVQSISDLERLL